MAGEGAKSGGPLQLDSKDWDKLLGEGEGEGAEPLSLVVVPGKSPQAKEMDENVSNNQLVSDLRNMTDKQLQQSADRIRKILPTLSLTLKDGGEKLKRSLQLHEDELRRRRLLPLQKSDDGGCKKLIQHHDQNCNGVSDDLREQPPSSLSPALSFSTCFSSKFDRKQTDSTTFKVFEKELSTLNPCGRQKMETQLPSLSSSRQKRGLSSKESPFQSLGSPLLNVDNVPLSNGYKRERRRSARLQASNSPKRIKETVVLVDEELEVEETAAQTNKLNQCKNTRIYYPSRDDPVSVETICYSDLDCLAPQAYLSSTIMNFYIRYLQVEGLTSKATESESCNYHFFNTYFYEKLKEALGEKDIENSFAKLRRWWKRIYIFEKAYVLIPIHENLHWSLVIICIPDVEDRSGPIMLHLDSLGLHSSRSIFSNIKSFLIEEWKFLRKREVPLDLPIADTVWENLSNRIDERIVQVPQQGNDYDCGLFVLFFMKRFIEEAPDRLKKKDLARFGKKWFNPEEASSLRQSIRSLLKEKFKNANDEEQLLDLGL
nr:ubiquitin-like-specific protease 1D isoform X3 [Coffea arabica]